MSSKKNAIKRIILAGVILTLAFVLCACNLFQSVDDVENYSKEPLINEYVSIKIDCSSILSNMDKLANGKEKYVPANGIIFNYERVQLRRNDTVFMLLMRLAKENGIMVNHNFSSKYGTKYIAGINNINEKDCGPKSGWTYYVNDDFPNYGVSKYKLKDGDKVLFRYVV